MIPKKQYLIFSHIMFEFILLNSCIIAVLLLKNPEATFLISDRIIDNVSIQLVMIYNIVWSAIVYFNGDKGFYTSQSVRKRFEFLTINIFLFIGMISTVAILFQVEIFNRTTFLLPIFVFSFLNFFLFSLLFEYYKMRNENPFNSNVLMIGADSRKFELEDFGKRIKSKGYQIEGYLIDNLSKNNNNRVARIDVLGELKDLSQVLENKSVDEIFIATAALRSKKIRSVISNADYHGVRVNLVPETPLFPSKLLKTYDLEGLPIFQHRQTPLMYLKKALLKRSFDIVFSILVLVLLSPVFLLIALMIWLDGGFNKSIFYKPHRKGEADESFKCFKFRTMSECDNPKNGTRSTVKNDPRITRVGKFLRKYDLDELPQFINVLKGDMSVVGPRPHRTNLQTDFRKVVNDYMVRHYVKPGVSGWAQVNGWRGPTRTDTQKKERIKHDLWYIENWSFWLDMKIIFLTVFSRKTRQNAF
ncbi:MAG: exopolysaccharide biosynthesis polyprenyl glycosylphosphotransferase [Saprospiraceae bacterium]|nr:exopolysaccharide biosynthesis polyprenyl glycosylphosphotransferase [Saprospiraceae bacterium]MDG2419645.1 exopolysaccharide biosynthesis polyprenyl glycosylphosphotransferase [Saprospiraceae bacterium]